MKRSEIEQQQANGDLVVGIDDGNSSHNSKRPRLLNDISTTGEILLLQMNHFIDLLQQLDQESLGQCPSELNSRLKVTSLFLLETLSKHQQEQTNLLPNPNPIPNPMPMPITPQSQSTPLQPLLLQTPQQSTTAIQQHCCELCEQHSSFGRAGCHCRVASYKRKWPLPPEGCKICGCHGCHITDVFPSVTKPPKLYVGQVPKEVREQDLRTLFAQYGEIVDLYLVRSKKNPGQHQGCAFVTFANKIQALFTISSLNKKVVSFNVDGSNINATLCIVMADSKPQETPQQQQTPLLLTPEHFIQTPHNTQQITQPSQQQQLLLQPPSTPLGAFQSSSSRLPNIKDLNL